jgi:DeoR/GlpR family transcriptional regulator of sugar metabolism
MLALERHRAILELLNEQGGARVADLALRFDVTEETIRRDLDKLEADGKLVRSHGVRWLRASAKLLIGSASM